MTVRAAFPYVFCILAAMSFCSAASAATTHTGDAPLLCPAQQSVHPTLPDATSLQPADPVASPADAPDFLSTLILLFIGVLCAAAIWRWKLLSPRPRAEPAPTDLTPPDRLRLRLEGATLIATALCVWVSQALGAAMARSSFALRGDELHSPRGVALLSSGAYAAAAIAAAACLLALPGLAGSIGLRPRARPALYGGAMFLLIAPVIFAIGAAAVWAAYWYASLTGQPPPDHVAHETLRSLADSPIGPDWWFAIAAVVIGAPIAEEFIYRGCLQSAIDRAFRGWSRRPSWAPVILTSLIFTAAHVSIAEPRALVSLFALSVAIGAVYRRTGNLAASIMVHSLFNATNIVLAV